MITEEAQLRRLQEEHRETMRRIQEEHREMMLAVERRRAELAGLDSAAAHAVEWWKTYRAALTGLHAFSHADSVLLVSDCHECAAQAADLAHGPRREVKP